MEQSFFQERIGSPAENTQFSSVQHEGAFVEHGQKHMDRYASRHSLSVVLPAHNEEQIIASTVSSVLEALGGWMKDFEVIVVDDINSGVYLTQK